MRYFLLVYDRQHGQMLAEAEFAEESDALRERFARERETGFAHDIEVVVLGAESHEALAATHARYFQSPDELLAAQH